MSFNEARLRTLGVPIGLTLFQTGFMLVRGLQALGLL